MQLVEFKVENFRSITKSEPIRFPPGLAVLIGPNNEGKSNILRGLNLSLSALEGIGAGGLGKPHPEGGLGFRLPMRHRLYEWSDDYPIDLQEGHPDGESVFRLRLRLSSDEQQEFRREVGSQINEYLPIELRFGPSLSRFKVRKQGPAATGLAGKAIQIGAFVSRRLRFKYIPAVRTASEAERVVQSLLASELSVVEKNEKYQDAMAAIAEVQRPVLERLSKSITGTLREFIPDVRAVRVEISVDSRYERLRTAAAMFVDDGVETALEAKGDGVVSLAAIGLLRHAAEPIESSASLILAIEEPESHLHPDGVHRIRGVLREIAEKHQVIISTHSPILVRFEDVSNNVVVRKQHASVASSISEIRDVLGVRASDNLTSAEAVLVVEGPHDADTLSALLRASSEKLDKAMTDRRLVVECLGGGSNLPYKAGQLNLLMCKRHFVLDHDKTAIDAYERAVAAGMVSPQEVSFAVVGGRRESELEDWLDPAVYDVEITSQFGPVLARPEFQSGRAKWSDRISKAFVARGSHWDASVENDIKGIVARAVVASPEKAIHAGAASAFHVLVEAAESMLG